MNQTSSDDILEAYDTFGIICCESSEATKFFSAPLTSSGIPIAAFGATSDVFSNKSHYPHVFRAVNPNRSVLQS